MVADDSVVNVAEAWNAPLSTLYVKPVLPLAVMVAAPLLAQGSAFFVIAALTVMVLPAHTSFAFTVMVAEPLQPVAFLATMV